MFTLDAVYPSEQAYFAALIYEIAPAVDKPPPNRAMMNQVAAELRDVLGDYFTECNGQGILVHPLSRPERNQDPILDDLSVPDWARFNCLCKACPTDVYKIYLAGFERHVVGRASVAGVSDATCFYECSCVAGSGSLDEYRLERLEDSAGRALATGTKIDPLCFTWDTIFSKRR